MPVPIFANKEVSDFYDTIQPWCHSDFPFLDPNYSPSSYMPAVDMTSFIAKCIAANKYNAITELLSYLSPDSTGTRALLANALLKRLPEWLSLDAPAQAEVHAIYVLLVRMAVTNINYSERTAGAVAATTLASHQLVVSGEYYETLLRHTKSEAKELGVDAKTSLQTAMSPLHSERPCADKIKSVTPIARLVIEDYVTRGWGVGKLRPSLYYGERMYGCGSQNNIIQIEALNFFEPPTDMTDPAAEITKEHLRESLLQIGVALNKSGSRKQMIQIARNIPGHMAALIEQITPEHKSLRAEYVESVKSWALRAKIIEPVALAILKIISLT